MQGKRYPVLVWIHGGGFFYGTSATLQPKDICSAFVSREIIVVTLNFRLGPLGFLDTEDGSVPGNLGLRDQIQGLEWVRENIREFGGDPDRISGGGHGSGAAALSAISLTRPNLMDSLILMSGSLLAPWAVTNHSRGSTRVLRRRLQCGRQEKTSDCLQRIPWTDLITLSPELWSPFMDGNEGLIPGDPRALLAASEGGGLPFLAGSNRDEAAFLVIEKLIKSRRILRKELFTTMLVPEFARDFLHSERKPLVDALNLQYFSLQPSRGLFDYLDNAIQLYTDFLYRSPLLLEATLRSSRPQSEVFLYSYENPSGIELANSPGWKGAPHGLDLLDLWGRESVKAQRGSFRINGPISSVLAPLLAAFVDNHTSLGDSKGNSGWRRFRDSSPNVLRIGSTIRVQSENLERRMNFWTEFIPGLLETLHALETSFTIPISTTLSTASELSNINQSMGIQSSTLTNPVPTPSIVDTNSIVNYIGDVNTPPALNYSIGDDPPTVIQQSDSNPERIPNSTVVIRAGPIPENRTVLWIMVVLALIFFMMFLVTAGGCAAWHKQSYEMPSAINTKSRHQNAQIRIPRIPERPPVYQNGHPRISVPQIPQAPPPPLPFSIHQTRR